MEKEMSEERRVARFLLMCLLEQSILFTQVDPDGKITESLRAGTPLDLSPQQLMIEFGAPMAKFLGLMDAPPDTLNGILRLFNFKED